jgi:hypothetical protein
VPPLLEVEQPEGETEREALCVKLEEAQAEADLL